jgi:lipoprotein Spr
METGTAGIVIPRKFLRVQYNGACYPGAPDLRGLAQGANCQHFAYELLRHFGRAVPDLRSSDLWSDTRFTRPVVRLRPLDLLLFNRTRRAWGAHLAVYLGGGRAIHLSKQVGTPIVWTLEEFAEHERYRVYLGAKRVIPAIPHG